MNFQGVLEYLSNSNFKEMYVFTATPIKRVGDVSDFGSTDAKSYLTDRELSVQTLRSQGNHSWENA